jgi:hypothetical protein
VGNPWLQVLERRHGERRGDWWRRQDRKNHEMPVKPLEFYKCILGQTYIYRYRYRYDIYDIIIYMIYMIYIYYIYDTYITNIYHINVHILHIRLKTNMELSSIGLDETCSYRTWYFGWFHVSFSGNVNPG